MITLNPFHRGIPLERFFHHSDDAGCPCAPVMEIVEGVGGQFHIALMHDGSYQETED